MVIGYHIMWTAYGCWLPNDPRGSSSQSLRVEDLSSLGEIHPGRKKIQPPSRELRQFYQGASQLLEHNRHLLSDDEILIVADSFAEAFRGFNYTRYACAIMLDHVHLVMRRHRDRAEVMIGKLQEASKKKLIEAGKRPVNHPVWGGQGWKVFLNTRADLEGRIKYVQENPIKAGRPEQHWEFVTPYDGWMPRPAY
jgi:REP element-mobilizing transposase RayT